MASLNTLRTKGGWIISIVIGLALLAFILPEVFRGSRGNNPNKIKVGQINGEMISYTEYNNRFEHFNNLMTVLNGRTNFSSEETARIQDMAWQDLINEYAFTPGFEKLGLMPFDAEQADMVTGQFISPIVLREFTDPQTGMFDRAALADFVSRLDDPNALMVWENLKKQMLEQRAQQKYFSLVAAAGANVTDMEAEAQYTADSKTLSAQVVAQLYSEIPDSLVEVTGADITKYYNAHKEMFRQKASRDIEYVVFNVLPSEEDYAAAQAAVDQMAAEFAVNTTPVQFATLNTQARMDNSFKKESEIPAEIAAVIWDKPEAMYGPVLTSDVYRMARLGEVKMISDTLGARHILLPPAAANADSIMTLLRGGASFAQVAEQFSVDPSAKQNDGDLGRFTPQMIDGMIPGFSEQLLSHKTGELFTINAQWGVQIVEKTYQSAPVKKAQVAMIEYAVDPGSATETNMLNNVREFRQAAAGSYDNFRKAVSENGLSKRVARVSATDRNISGLPDSRELVRWAFSHEKGTVSNDVRIGADTYVVAVITGVAEDGIAPMDQYKDEIRMAVARQKKGELLASKMTGNTIGEVAAAAGKEVVDVRNVRFSAYSVPGVGGDSKLVGAITSGIAEGVLSKPVIGDNGVYRFVITGSESNEVTKDAVKVTLESSGGMYLDQRLVNALNGIAGIQDGRVRYF